MSKLFGTDGIRGEAGRFPLDAETVHAAGRSLANHLTTALGGERAPRVIIGRDTRESGSWLEQALISGARSAGAECESAGVITTPGIAYLARTLPADAGVVLSASHNPYQDNGIKIFAPSGRKLDDAMERLIEADINASAAARASEPPRSQFVAEKAPAFSNEDEMAKAAALRERYLNYLVEDVAKNLQLDKLRIGVDCANGAACTSAPELFGRLGAGVYAINNTPDGRNINYECGSLHIEGLQRKVVEEKLDIGVAFDGDADRALFIDKHGQLVDGDATLWVMTQYLAKQGELVGGCVVATVMSNIGLELALEKRGLRLLRTPVGDKYVLEELLRTGAAVGGEQSGHIIFPREGLAGDGMITALYVLRAMRESEAELDELTAGFVGYPQVLLGVRVREKLPFDQVPEISQVSSEIEAELHGSGRLLLRYSGTEPLARVMIEGKRQDRIEQLARKLVTAIESTIGVSAS